MKKLVIDSATNCLYIGLINEDKFDEKIRIGNNDNASYIIVLINELLKKNNLNIKNIKEIIVGIGPGSYTGIKAAVTVSKILAYSLKINLKAISSLNLLTSGYKDKHYALIDARGNYFFSGCFLNGKIEGEEKYLKKDDIKDLQNLIIINSNTMKIDLKVVDENSFIIENIQDLVPNYLRKTAAEDNYDKKNDNWWYS